MKYLRRIMEFRKISDDSISMFAKNYVAPERNLSKYRDYLDKIDMESVKSFRWDLGSDEVKVFMDITPISHPTQTFFGKAIIGFGAFKDMISGKYSKEKNLRLEKVNHVGFIFKNGEVLHATSTGKGVDFERYPDVISKPDCYLVYNIGGREDDIRKLGKELISSISKEVEEKKCSSCSGKGKVLDGRSFVKCEDCDGTGESPERYDFKGIVRQVLPDWINRIFLSEKSEHKFFCSELVSNLLVRCKIMTFDQLKSLHLRKSIAYDTKGKSIMAANEERSNDLAKYDEIDPTKLYRFIVQYGEMANLIVEYKDGRTETIKPSEQIG